METPATLIVHVIDEEQEYSKRLCKDMSLTFVPYKDLSISFQTALFEEYTDVLEKADKWQYQVLGGIFVIEQVSYTIDIQNRGAFHMSTTIKCKNPGEVDNVSKQLNIGFGFPFCPKEVT